MLNRDFFIKLKKKFKSIFRNFLSIFLQYLALNFKFLKFDFRVININIFRCLEFTDQSFKKYKLGNNFEDFVCKILNLVKFKRLNINLLKIFFFLINYSSNRFFYKKFYQRIYSKLCANYII